MRFSVKAGALADAKADVLVVGIHAGSKQLEGPAAVLDRRMRGGLAEVLGYGEFSGQLGETAFVPGTRLSAQRVLAVGLGKKKDFDQERVRQAFGHAQNACQKAKLRNVAAVLPEGIEACGAAQALAEGMALAGYDVGLHKTKAKSRQPKAVSRVTLMVEGDVEAAKAGLARGEAMAAGANFTRDLVNQPSNELTPTKMAEAARAMAAEFDTVDCKVWGPKEIEKNQMGGLMGVGRGSEEPSQFIMLEYKPKDAPKNLKKIAFVGKGLTFDTGGISIKPAQGMELMKFDMGGAGAVLGAFKILGALQPQVHVLGYIASAENMPDGKAIKPGDLLRMMSGLTVEVNNTDAEGRLVLADALHYAKQQKPAFIVDAATLTGACMIALGDVACGLMSEDDALVELIQGASKVVDEPVWRLPLMDAHRKKMEGQVADLKNTGPREGGALTAAGFLSRFAEGARWAHLDIAGTVWSEENKAYQGKGATGFGARLFAAIAESAAE